jgi:hypothetical protein
MAGAYSSIPLLTSVDYIANDRTLQKFLVHTDGSGCFVPGTQKHRPNLEALLELLIEDETLKFPYNRAVV